MESVAGVVSSASAAACVIERESCKLSYDRKYDILYIRMSSEPSYGDESQDDGIVVMHSIANDKITGEIVFDIRDRLSTQATCLDKLPVPLDSLRDKIAKLLEGQATCGRQARNSPQI